MVIKRETLHEKLKVYRLYSIRNLIRLRKQKIVNRKRFSKRQKDRKKKIVNIVFGPPRQ